MLEVRNPMSEHQTGGLRQVEDHAPLHLQGLLQLPSKRYDPPLQYGHDPVLIKQGGGGHEDIDVEVGGVIRTTQLLEGVFEPGPPLHRDPKDPSSAGPAAMRHLLDEPLLLQPPQRAVDMAVVAARPPVHMSSPQIELEFVAMHGGTNEGREDDNVGLGETAHMGSVPK